MTNTVLCGSVCRLGANPTKTVLNQLKTVLKIHYPTKTFFNSTKTILNAA